MAQGVLGADYADGRAAPGEVRFRYRVRARIAADAILAALGSAPLRILDLGAADGRGLRELSRLLPGSRICGIEASKSLIDAAPSLPEDVSLIHGDVTAIHDRFSENSFDVVTALAILEHLPRPEAAIHEAGRVLRPGGLLVASCPHGSWDRLATRLGLLNDGQHEHRLDRSRLERLANDGGFEAVDYRRFMLAPVGVLPYLRIPVSARLALAADRVVARWRVFDWLFVNQLLIARRPGSAEATPVPE